MARFKYDEVDKYGGQGGGGFLYLQDDGDVARVRLMYNSIDDVEGLSVHQIEINGKKRYVNCLRSYNDPIDACPFCRERMFTAAKLFVPIYNIDEERAQTWERGKTFFSKISGICARYPNVVSHTFEIERHGKKKDNRTTYEIYECGQDDTTLDDLPEKPVILGGLVLDKTAEEMEYYLDNGEFEQVESNNRSSRRSSDEVESRSVMGTRETQRRTPATSRNKEDAF